MKANIIKGFTLIEMMVVVAIIAILAAIAIPQYQDYIVRTQLQRVVAEAGALKTSMETCMTNGQTLIGPLEGTNLNGSPRALAELCDYGPSYSSLIEDIEMWGEGGGFADAPSGFGKVAAAIVTYTNPYTKIAILDAKLGNSASSILKKENVVVQWLRSGNGDWACIIGTRDSVRSDWFLNDSSDALKTLPSNLIKYMPNDCIATK